MSYYTDNRTDSLSREHEFVSNLYFQTGAWFTSYVNPSQRKIPKVIVYLILFARKN